MLRLSSNVFFKLNPEEAIIISLDSDNFFTLRGMLLKALEPLNHGTTYDNLLGILTNSTASSEQVGEDIDSLILYLSNWGLLENSSPIDEPSLELHTPSGDITSRPIELKEIPMYAKLKINIEP